MPEAPAAPPPAPAPAAPQPAVAPPQGDRGNLPGESPAVHEEALGEAFADLDKMYNEPAQTGTRRGPSAPAAPKAPEAKPTPKEAPKPGELEKPRVDARGREHAPDGKLLPKQPEPAAEPPIEKMAPADLRKAYEGLRNKLTTLEAEHTKLKAAPAKPQTPGEDPERKALTERLAEREKHAASLEEEMRFLDYQRSQEYKDRYEKPFIDAWKMGQERAIRLKTAPVVDELGDETTPARQGTGEDFNTLMSIQDDDQAAEWAAKTFGTQKAAVLLYHRERVQETNNAKYQALEEYKTKGAEREKERRTMVENHTKAVRDLYHKVKDAGVEKYPQFFRPDESDPKTQELLDKGMRLADRALGAPDVEGEKPLSGEERVRLQAAMRNCFGGFQNVIYQLKKANARASELEKQLAEYEASVPKGGDGRGRGTAPATTDDETPEGAFDHAFGTR